MELSSNYNYLGDATLGNTLTYRIQEIPSNNLTAQRNHCLDRRIGFPASSKRVLQLCSLSGSNRGLLRYSELGQHFPTVTHIKMTLESSGNSTQFSFRDIQYNEAPASLFDSDQPRNLARQRFWSEAKPSVSRKWH
jgi:hypothetical protein